MSLRTAIMLSVAAVFAVAFVVAVWLFSVGLARYTQQTAPAAVETRSNALATFVSRALFEEWQRVEQRAAQIAPTGSPDSMQAAVDSLATNDEKTSWVGIAKADGTVLAASRGLLVGENVASRPWFNEGLKGSFAGDVHEAVLLARLLNPEGDEPLRFIDFAAPIRNADGSVWGVLGTHVNWPSSGPQLLLGRAEEHLRARRRGSGGGARQSGSRTSTRLRRTSRTALPRPRWASRRPTG